MPYNKYFFQKCLFASAITIINTSAISLAFVYSQYWYLVNIPLLLVLFFNLTTVFLATVCALIKTNKKLPLQCVPATTLGYFIPCYNESAIEINNSLQSFYLQKHLERQKQLYLTVCDGRKKGAGNRISTDKILSNQIFPNSQVTYIKGGYLSARATPIDVEILSGNCPNGFPYFTIIKDQNQGKRDSIAIMRRLFYAFNTQRCPPCLSQVLLNQFTRFMRINGIFKIQFVIGVDADTAFEKSCSIQLLREICRKENILATSGMVKVSFLPDSTCKDKLWEGYQHVEYLAGQGLLRNQQNLTQQKINCLPGCLNITRVCEETCGQRLMGEEYMYPPNKNTNIFQQIRATASQDRHSVMLLLKMYKNCHTTVNWHAQAETAVPINLSVFLSQRRRWSLGSATHGMWMIFMDNIPLWERISSMIFVLTYLLNPFLMYSAVVWIYVIVNGHGDQIFYIMTGVVQILTIYKLVVPLWCPMTCKDRFIFYLFYLPYVLFGPFLGIMVLCYSIYNMDDFGWGKTRLVIDEKQTVPIIPEVSVIDHTLEFEKAKPFPRYKMQTVLTQKVLVAKDENRVYPMYPLNSSNSDEISNVSATILQRYKKQGLLRTQRL